ncbi:HAD family hydrolase [Chitinophaga pendula]|uniref:D-glycero-alpha-D-manno-heptose-1,7-bisphosphate 7-phosphatase n=1 Tax=Chitinophaga TaxID=79328 RepID=UPI000BAED112|nr:MULTISPECIES: HAD family hydrolase [Chitinophaga]ASZ15093.1 HAD family hydrolase [Chitinophaga sp. MD30]UCJ08552.1 HAD family hydrolase [Chitinophaga pendula]
MNKAVFLDKDGTLIVDVPYNIDPNRIVLEEGAEKALQLLKKAGFLLVIISNQGGIAKGVIQEQQLAGVEQRINELLAEVEIRLDGFFYCPHDPKGKIAAYTKSCYCRKPAPGLLLQAASVLNIDLEASWMIGDILNDVEAGHRAGCRSILIDNGNETEWLLNDYRIPDFFADNLQEAAAYIQMVAKTYDYESDIL